MVIQLNGGEDLYHALLQAGFRITRTKSGFVVTVGTLRQLNKIARIALDFELVADI